ncbi:MAG: UDP-glucose/GDP-mannose dehydrogenase family protein [Simkaniaceae bacterium]|nr:UDP-glucose/GDP-mannose dehydrogenase family protein [Simkaniaceae bacterium]
MNILMIGTGYVGLVTGVCFAEMGHQVICLDIDEQKIEDLRAGVIPIYEPGLSELVTKNAAAHRLHFTTDFAQALANSRAVFLALPTPCDETGACNLTYVKEVASQIGKEMQETKLIVNKSTAPVGTVEEINKLITKELDSRQVSIPFDVVSNPEFLKEGSAVSDCMKPDRIIVGSNSTDAFQLMQEIYRPFNMNHNRLIHMDVRSAEMTKYAANVMLASRISLMNEFSRLCEKNGANVNQVRVGIGSDSRIGYQAIYPGIGFGGSCFPKDLRALRSQGRHLGVATPLSDAIERVNEEQKHTLFQKIDSYFDSLSNATIAIWGLSYKPDTDDIREAPSIPLIASLLDAGATVRLYDPEAMDRMKKLFPESNSLHYCQSEHEAAIGADGIALVTEWKQFRLVDFEKLGPLMNGHVIFDGRNQYQPTEMTRLGFDYFGVGIPIVRKEALV